MDQIWEFIKQIIATRGAQLASRYVSKGLLMLATWAGIQPDDGHTSTFIVSLIVAIACMGVDLLSHAIQRDQVQREIETRASGRTNGGLIPLVVFALLALPGCALGDRIQAGVMAGVVSLGTHIHPEIHFDAATMTATATVQWRDANGQIHVREATAEELRAQCLACNDHAQAELRASYRKAIADMVAVERRELAALRAARGKCGSTSWTVPAIPVAPVPVVVSEPAGSDDNFTIPGKK